MADVTMSLDNVLSVAGAAKGHFMLLIFGLALSIALMAFAANFIASLLEDYNLPFIQTREPGGTLIGEALRELLLSKEGTAPSVTTELLMV